MSSIADRVRAIIIKELEIEPDHVVDGADLIDDLEFDSLDIVSLTLALEDEFPIEIPDDHMDGFGTVAQIISYIEGRMQA